MGVDPASLADTTQTGGLGARAERGAPPRGLSALPGVRTFRSRRFRTVLAGALWLIGASILSLVLLHQANDPAGQYAIDFGDYQAAAQRMAHGASPYAPEMLTRPIDAQGIDRYRYPPPLAQVLEPLSGLPVRSAAAIWLLLQAAAVLAAMWIAVRAGGARRSLETLLWCGVAATWFMPVFDTLWKGNVSGFLALAVALALAGGSTGGVAIALATLLKLVPIVYWPGLAGGPRRPLVAAGVTLLGVAGVSLLLAPGAWSDYAVVLPNLLAGRADEITNLAPATVISRLGGPDVLATAARLAALATVLICCGAAFLVAHRPRGAAAAVTLGTAAMLLLPAALWYHYLAATLPLAACAWPAASARRRGALLGGAALVLVGLAWLPAALVGGAVMISVSLAAVWPRTSASDPAGQLVGSPAAGSPGS